ncbi:aconitate hydratase AcnA [Methylomonas sp. SURF-1]|uniref:Aconitate hydratase n=1 Tax=Methylomonas aurea TaxID=2952224 RepID=A0ABT1UNE9_9GAMM|nr:aconitate hydratase AcnA [Methylomonas sp. SURF-1]MCQ8183348.1 aconitate hydratase AcnA [Methylomonas sp. SURF-1]
MANFDPFGVIRPLGLASAPRSIYYSLPDLNIGNGMDIARLPFSIKILLESALRHCDGYQILEEDVLKLAGWQAHGDRHEIPFKPARVVLQDFTGVPALVDLAAMRDAISNLGGDPGKVNPLVPCDLVIDHSVQVDYFGKANALAMNETLEFQRNAERYAFLKWGQAAFRNLRVVPPATGIVHQVNLEYLASVVFRDNTANVCYPDSCVGTDSHTPMVNGLGVLAWGVGGIEAEAVMLDQPIYMLLPDVVGIKLIGDLPPGVTATDLVLRLTELCRQIGVVGKFVEFFGSGLSTLSVADRATISNMAPEQGATVSYFPIDAETLDYLRLTGRSDEQIALVKRYARQQGLFRDESTSAPEFSQVVEVDLAAIEPSVAGPKRPQDRIPLSRVGPSYRQMLIAPAGNQGIGLAESELNRQAAVTIRGTTETISHGAVAIAAITSCTNTSNPSVMIAAGLLAKKAAEKGLKVKNYVKTSLAPGSLVVTDYLQKSGLLPYLEQLGFYLVGYGCTTCIGNSGPLDPAVEKAILDNHLVASAVLSGNRNFEGRVHPLTKTNYLASPPLVVAFALAGSTAVDISRDPLGTGSDGQPVYLKDVWPSNREITDTIKQFVTPHIFKQRYADVFSGSPAWQQIPVAVSERYQWQADSTYIRKPPFFEGMTKITQSIAPLTDLRVLALFGDSVTTDHISPAGQIAADSPAAAYLLEHGIARNDWNSYGSRRGNDEVMSRGTFANIRIRNLLVPGGEGNLTVHHPSGDRLSFFDAAIRYKQAGTPLCILAGKEYGSGSSRDWAAKGPYLLGVKVVIAESYERIHRSNLIGMGILPLQFLAGDTVTNLQLTGNEVFSIDLSDAITSREIHVSAAAKDGSTIHFRTISRVDTAIEAQYYRDGGILRTVLKKLLQTATT